MNAHSGNKLSAAMAQNGIFFRDFAATTYAGSGGGGKELTDALGATGSMVFATEATDCWLCADAGGSDVVATPDPSNASRRSLERFSRCSGISVTRILFAVDPVEGLP